MPTVLGARHGAYNEAVVGLAGIHSIHRGLECDMNNELEKVMKDVDESAAECYSEIKEKAAELCNSVEAYVRKEPMKGVLLAAGLGLVAGLLMSRR